MATIRKLATLALIVLCLVLAEHFRVEEPQPVDMTGQEAVRAIQEAGR